MASHKDNVLLIITDQQRHESVKPGEPWSTPRLQALADQGCLFDNAYTTCALCSPARASILTGLYPHNHGMWRNCDTFQYAAPDLPEDKRIISQELAEAGYRCGYIGKWHVGSNRMPGDYDFEGMDVAGYGDPYATPEYAAYCAKHNLQPAVRKPELFQYGDSGEPLYGITEGDEPAHAAVFLAEMMIDQLRDFSQNDKPFFSVFSLWDPHSPYMPPQTWADRFKAEDMKLPASLSEDFTDNPVRKRWKESFYTITTDMTPLQWQTAMARCAAQTAFMDEQIGTVLDALDELGLADTTAVIMTADHGDMIGAHGGQFDKGPFMYDEIYRVPFIVRYPGMASPKTVSDKLVSNMDAAATILDLAGCSIDHMDARSLVPVLKDPEAQWPDDLMSETHGHRFLCSNRMVRFRHYKFIFNSMEAEELYALDTDPHEMNNLAADPGMRNVRDEGAARLVRALQASADPLAGTVQHMCSVSSDFSFPEH